MNKRIIINPELCDGCGICELICAEHRTGQWHPALSRIRIKVLKIRGEENLNQPVTCTHCEDPFCARACLMNVISKDPVRGLTARRESSCIGCHACEIACPFGACSFDYINEVVVNCDLCHGDPLCVKFCPSKALQFGPVNEAASQRRSEAAARMIYSY
ncbi:MAG: 4Fe-4S dicluster domain-containing protein [Syntrophomonas sp.]